MYISILEQNYKQIPPIVVDRGRLTHIHLKPTYRTLNLTKKQSKNKLKKSKTPPKTSATKFFLERRLKKLSKPPPIQRRKKRKKITPNKYLPKSHPVILIDRLLGNKNAIDKKKTRIPNTKLSK